MSQISLGRIWRRVAGPALVAFGSITTLLAAGLEAPNQQAPASSPGILLEIPEYGDQLHSPGVLRLPQPQGIRQLVIHVPGERIHQAFPKVNTLGTGAVHRVRVKKGVTLYHINLDLNQSQRYDLGPESNTIEIKVIDRPGASPKYVKWVVLPPEEGASWVAEDPASGSDGPQAVAAMSSAGVVILEEGRDGTVETLNDGWTAARRVFVQARFTRQQESVSLRIHRKGDDSSSRTATAGVWNSGAATRTPTRGIQLAGQDSAVLEAPVDLLLGTNHLEVEVLHGYEILSRTLYRIVRRTPTDPREIAGEKWAVVIGVSDYRAEGMDLRYAHADAKAMRDFLEQRAGFARERIRLLTDVEATQKSIRSAFFSFLAATEPDDLVVLFLAGHGVQNKKNLDHFYFLAHDSELQDLGGTAIPMWELGNVMNHSVKARNILVMADTCHSGAATERAGVVDGTGLNFFNKYLETVAQKRGRLVLTASQAHQSSLELDRFGHGVFTHYLLKGLEGEADDNPRDGVVTAGEVVDFLRRAVPKETQGEQHPSFRDVGFDLNLPLSHRSVEAVAKR